MKGKMKKWMLALFAAFALTLMLGATVSAASNMPVDGKLRNYYGTYGTNSYYRRHRIFVTGYGRLEISGKTESNGAIAIRLIARDGKLTTDGGHAFYSVNIAAGTSLYYGVMRGPYYIDVAGVGSNTANNRYYKVSDYYLGAYQTLMSNNGGLYQSRAYYLSSGKTYTGAMPFNEDWGNADWYRFYLSSNRKFDIQFQSKGVGYAEIRLWGPSIPSSGELIYKGSINGLGRKWTLYRQSNYGYTTGRPAGTYYIRIKRYDNKWKRTSMGYWLRWS